MAWISGVACTEFGRLPGLNAIGWQSRAARAAIADAGLEPAQVDGLLAGYATTLRHLMPADLLAEYLGLKPTVAFGVSAGGATGPSMVATAAALVDSGSAHTVLVVGGENRASGQTSDTSIETLAQVGHSRYEVPLGANVPAYYALLASHYLHSRGLDAASLSPLAVQMRRTRSPRRERISRRPSPNRTYRRLRSSPIPCVYWTVVPSPTVVPHS